MSTPSPDPRRVAGWDIGGAHVKACLLEDGVVQEVVQWPCPLWQGLDRLDQVLARARAALPALDGATHAVTMTGEMVDAFADRQDGVTRIAGALRAGLRGPLQFYAGDAGWCALAEAPAHWASIASANWLATARHGAARLASGVLVDIGSTTTDLIAWRDGGLLTTARSDAARLATGELVYHGVVRTPLCALAPRIAFRGMTMNVMHEFFATTADVYRSTGELDPAHDQQPSADGAPKTPDATRQRLARMIGLDARDATDADWLEVARAWRAAQLAEIGGQLLRVRKAHDLPRETTLVAAGCGAFLAHALAATDGLRCVDYAVAVAGVNGAAARWAQVCAPSVAVAMLHDEGMR